MADMFLKILNMSISASWIVLAVLVLRLLLKKAPKWINCLLWGIVGLRLIMPFSFESVFSLIPSAETISKAPNAPRPHLESGITVFDNQVNGYIKETYFEGVTKPTGYFADITNLLGIVWVIGILGFILYAIFSYLQLKNRVNTAVVLDNNIFQSENVISPFVLGIIKPRIYLPFGMNEQDMKHVIAHEQAHMKRKDHWWKPLGFLILSIHWFNPLIWLGYILLCRDIELACDEKVVKELDVAQRADYSEALLMCSVNRHLIAACPLAFGEVGVKDRVKSVLHYKKPAFWLVMVAIAVSVVFAVCFLTNPADESDRNLNRILRQDRGYEIIEQHEQKVTLTMPVSKLPDQIFTEEGIAFDEKDVVAYQDETTTIYLKEAQYSNEGKENLYFCFDFTFNLPKEQGNFLYPYERITETMSSNAVKTVDGVLRADNVVFEDAVNDRGQGSYNLIWFYVSTEALRQAEGTISFDIYLNQIRYTLDSDQHAVN